MCKRQKSYAYVTGLLKSTHVRHVIDEKFYLMVSSFLSQRMGTESPQIPESILQVGEVIKPSLSESTAREIIHRLYGLYVITLKELNSYDDRNYFITVKPEHSNPYMDTPSPDGYVLKVLNSMDSKKLDYVGKLITLQFFCKKEKVFLVLRVTVNKKLIFF